MTVAAAPMPAGDEQPAVLRLWDRRAAFAPFAVAGSFSVVAGGLLAAAIAAPAPTRHGVWAAAYLVLVLGVGQVVLAAGQLVLAAEPPSTRAVAVTAALFNGGNVAVLIGVITGHIVVFDAGSVLLLVALLLFGYQVRRAARRGWALHLYRLFIATLAVSIPIGLLITSAAAG